jgi:hypothetical protein
MSKKNIKSNKKKSVRGKYKIEALEPRLRKSASRCGSNMKTGELVFASLALRVVMDAD